MALFKETHMKSKAHFAENVPKVVHCPHPETEIEVKLVRTQAVALPNTCFLGLKMICLTVQCSLSF